MKSDYSYEIIDRIILITDLNKGGKSVTNDIENVLQEIKRREDISLLNYKIAYRDSMGRWDGIDINSKNLFFSINGKNKEDVLSFFGIPHV